MFHEPIILFKKFLKNKNIPAPNLTSVRGPYKGGILTNHFNRSAFFGIINIFMFNEHTHYNCYYVFHYKSKPMTGITMTRLFDVFVLFDRSTENMDTHYHNCFSIILQVSCTNKHIFRTANLQLSISLCIRICKKSVCEHNNNNIQHL